MTRLDLFLQTLKDKAGKPFYQGGRGSRGYDCVSLITTSMEEVGYEFEYKKSYARTESDLYLQFIDQIATQIVDYNDIQPGDIVVNHKYNIKHFAVYIGDKQIIHCHPKYGKVATHYINSSYLKNSSIYRLKNG